MTTTTPLSQCQAIVVAVNADQLLLKTHRAGCASCQHSCTVKLQGNGSDYIKFRRDDLAGLPPSLQAGEQVQLIVETRRLISLSLLVYLAPLVLMLLLTGLANHLYSHSDAIVAVSAFVGLFIGLATVSCTLRLHENSKNAVLLPVLQRHDSE